ncbi:MAG: nuclear transport factor 2 family protein [Flavobacteriales bacterium]|nr:nuclear transport factor 2 family protein [Flavobacteriales bacterium]
MRLQQYILLAALGSTLLFGCSEPCPPAPEHFTHSLLSVPPETDANIAVVEGFLNACVKADVEGMRAAMAPGYHELLQTTPIDSSDAEKVIFDWVAMDSTRTDQQLTMDAVEGIRHASGEWQGDWVHYWGEYKATHKATGKRFVVPFFFDTQLKDGKLLRAYIYYDMLSVYDQLGIAPPAAPANK